MNVIRFNKKKISKLLFVLVSFYLLKCLLEYCFQKEEPSLSYYELERKFYIKLNSVYIRNLKINEDSRKHSEFYHLDQNDNIQVETVQENGKLRQPFQIKSALIIYSKILVENWVSAIENAVYLGLNTIEIEIPWNIHEPIENKFDFTSYSNDLESFIKLVFKFGLYVIIRIDPYIPCSSYDFGGLPSWLLKDTDSINSILADVEDNFFSFSFKNYLDKLLPIIYDNQLVRNGPIIGILIQHYQPDSEILNSNQLLKFYNQNYVTFIKEMLDYHNIVELLLKSFSMCDSESDSYNSFCDKRISLYLPIDFKMNSKLFTKLFSSPVKIKPEYNCIGEKDSYFNYWVPNKFKLTETFNNDLINVILNNILNFKSNLVEVVELKKSFSIKNYFCTTNYAFSHGAHHNRLNNDYLPISTSSLNSFYECLINENGDLTDKYWLTNKILKYGSFKMSKKFMFDLFNQSYLLSQFEKLKPISPNDFLSNDDKEIEIEKLIHLKSSHLLFFNNFVDLLQAPINLKKDTNELNMEYLSSNYKIETSNQGFILYRIKIDLPKDSLIRIEPFYIRDYGVLICDNVHLLTINNLNKISNETILIKLKTNCHNLAILVENMGRLSDMTSLVEIDWQRKGLLVKYAISFQKSNNKNYQIGDLNWKINFLDFSQKFFNRVHLNSKWSKTDLNFTNSENLPFMAYFKFNIKKLDKFDLRSNSMYSNNQTKSDRGAYILLNNWNKGIIFINGFNLGRYWKIGPLNTIFIPHFLLYNGMNEMIIFELHNIKKDYIYFSNKHFTI